MDAYNRVIDAAYATALDYKFSVSLGAALQALPISASDDETLVSHLSRARRIAAERTEQSFELPGLIFEEFDSDPIVRGATPLDDLDGISHISTPAGQNLARPKSWSSLLHWLDPLVKVDAPLRLVFNFHNTKQPEIAAFAERFFDKTGQGRLNLLFPPQISRDDQTVMHLIQRSLGLSKRQSEIAAAVTSGLTAEEISGELAISPNTVRHHIKAIYQRLGVRKQIDVATIVGQIKLLKARAPITPSTGSSKTDGPYFSATNFAFSQKSGRRICYSECGDRAGRPCIMFHSSFGGRWVTEEAARALWKLNLRLFIVERPGIGLTDQVEVGRFSGSIDDVFSVLDQLNILRAHGLSFSGGAFYLADAIDRCPDRFESAHFISPRAFNVTDAAFGDAASPVSNLSGLPIEAAELINEAVDSIDPSVGWRQHIRMTLAENPIDLEALNNPELMQMHIDQARSNLAMGAVGVGNEWRDYGANFNPPPVSNIRCTVSCGAEDNIVNIRQGAEDWSRHLHVAPITISHAGHLVFLTHTTALLESLGLKF